MALHSDRPFPARPDTDDEWRTELLDLMSVEGRPNVFLLGTFAKYVTIYAQQVRALNLVAALASGGRLSISSRVAVVGGGIAGMTAAAAAAAAGARENGPRNDDEYAFADVVIVALLLDQRGWRDAVKEFLRRAPNGTYARTVTLDLLKEVAAGVQRGGAVTSPLTKRLQEALSAAA